MNKTIVCGLTGNVDAVVQLDKYLFQNLSKKSNSTKFHNHSPTVFIHSWDDLIHAISWNINHGTGAEYIITNKNIFCELSEIIEWKFTIGGTGLQAAIAACTAGYRATVNLPSWSKEYDSLLNYDSLEVVSGLEKNTPIHFIFEYNQSEHTGLHYNTQRQVSNRIIFRGSKEFKSPIIAPGMINKIKKLNKENLWMLISGYNAFESSEEVYKLVSETSIFLTSLGSFRPFVHIELADIPKIEDQHFVIDKLSPIVNNIGLNEDELQKLLGIKSLLQLTDQEIISTLTEAHKRFNVDNLIVHTHQFAACVSKNEPKKWRKALLNGVKFATARALTGKCCTENEIIQLTNPLPAHKRGEKMEKLTLNNRNITIVPAYKINPISTIGLGDTFTAGLILKAPDESK